VFTLALRGVRFNTARYVATLLAIITGVAFFAATGFVSDRVIDALEGDVDRQYGNVDVAVVVKDDGPTNEDFAKTLVIPGEAAARFRAANGVTAGGGVLTGPVTFVGGDGSTFGDGTTGRLWIADDSLNPLDVVEGRAPQQPGEVAVDRGTVSRESLTVGQRLKVLTVSGPHDAVLTGVTEFGNTDSIDTGGTVSIPSSSAFEWLRDGRVQYESYYLRGSSSPEQLTREISPLAPPGYLAETGDAFRQDKRDEVGSIGRILKQGLQGFALLALFVGAFVIYNTFSVIVAQRQRELAVLSAIGATPKQIKRSLRYEGLVIGLVGSALGVVVGIGLTFVLILALQALGVELPGSGIKINSSPVISGIVLGTLITFFSVTIPARRAGRVEPIEALRDAAAETGTLSRRRGVVAAVLVVLGLGGLLFASGIAGVGVSALMLVVGAIVAGPFIAVGGAHMLKPVLRRSGLEGRLAVDNSARNPKRTATTANALLIGVFLVTFVTVAGTSLKDYVVGEIQRLDSADYLISSDGGSIDPALVTRLESVEGVEKVTPYRLESVTINGKPTLLSTADNGALVKIAGIKATKGSLSELGDGTIAVSSQTGEGIRPGASVNVVTSQGATRDLRVVAVLDTTIDAADVGNLVEPTTFDALVGETAPTAAFIDAVDGAESDTRDAIDNVVARRPDITVTEGNALGKTVASVFDFLINAVNGLLLMSVIVALIGIVNTLSLSILERRRELGLLRVMGMVDKKVQRMVRLESALIAALGTVSGIAVGLAIGWGLIAAINRLSDASISFGFPAFRLLLVLVLGIVLGLLASYIPARRSTRLEVLDAIQAT